MTSVARYIGAIPCFFGRCRSRFESVSSSARISTRRVSRGDVRFGSNAPGVDRSELDPDAVRAIVRALAATP